MVDEFMVCVDRIILTSSAAYCFRGDSSSVNGMESLLSNAGSIAGKPEEVVVNASREGFCSAGCGEGCSKGGGVVRECRICQEEDDEKDMEAPCACNGTLKFAHRKCIQRWCNKKGDITCEICSQVFSPNYTLPPARSNPDVLAIDISQAWGPAIDLRDPRFLAFATAEHQLLQSEYDDYAIASSSSLACFRYVAIIMMLLLSVRQMLMVARDFQMLRESSSFFNFQISLLQLAGFLLPCYVMARSWYVVQCRRRRQVSYLSETACLTALFQLEFCSTHGQIISSYSGLLKLAIPIKSLHLSKGGKIVW
nr:Protein involved in mRNA turnover and stability [Ipomoea batatas]